MFVTAAVTVLIENSSEGMSKSSEGFSIKTATSSVSVNVSWAGAKASPSVLVDRIMGSQLSRQLKPHERIRQTLVDCSVAKESAPR